MATATRIHVCVAKRFGELKERNHNLTIYAPVDGVVLSRNLETLLGKYVTPGTEIIQIGDSLPHGGFAAPFQGPLTVIQDETTEAATDSDPNQASQQGFV